MKLRLSVNNMSIIEGFVDASDRTYMDYKGHTGAYMTLGKGAVTSMSTKHKINTKISTESEFVGADDDLPAALWSKYFIEAQGYTVTQDIMYQDKQATLRLEVNGKFSSSKRTKHIKARYFSSQIALHTGTLKSNTVPLK